MTALPAELPNRLSNSPTIKGAYTIVLRFQQSAKMHLDPKRLIYARILGYLMLAGPSDEARVAVALEVISCADEDALALNGKMYYDHYMRACKLLLLSVCPHSERYSTVKKTKGRTPIPSSHASRPSFDTRKAMIMDMLVEAPQSHRDAKKNVSALVMAFFRNLPTPCLFLRLWFETAFAALSRDSMKSLRWKIIKS
jgi:hypothetical protein